jgi:outer membrane protein OmpA-like peptidoglycan-associated protein
VLNETYSDVDLCNLDDLIQDSILSFILINIMSLNFNQVLSEYIPESIRNLLALEVYINARRFTFVGYGEFKPIVSCSMMDCTEEEHQLNRRSEFEIIKY